jgi:hypothetical protein
MDRIERKKFLKTVFPNYDARYHDAFEIAYTHYLDDCKLWEYNKNRNIPQGNAPNVLWYEPSGG